MPAFALCIANVSYLLSLQILKIKEIYKTNLDTLVADISGPKMINELL
jgi:hypothetical protein